MNPARRNAGSSSWSASVAVCAAVMMGYHVASRAARDTLFLSNFDVGRLPLVHAAAAALAIVAAVVAGRFLAAHGTRRVVPVAFLVSAALTAVETYVLAVQPRLAAVLIYLHVGAISPVLVSGFWSHFGDTLDPRSARRIGALAAVATLGGVIGGVFAERLSAWGGVASVLPALAVAQAVCGWALRASAAPADRGATAAAPRPEESVVDGVREMFANPHLRNLALVVVGSSVAAGIVDFAFKTSARANAADELDLMRVFLGFNTLVALGTFGLQLRFGRLIAGATGLRRSLAILPGSVVVGGALGALFPVAWMAAGLRGTESILRGSVFRSAYEVLFAALPPARRRAIRAVIDVACDRAGDVLGAGLVLLVLAAAPLAPTSVFFALAAVIALLTLTRMPSLHVGHLRSVEEFLRERRHAPQRTVVEARIAAAALEYATGGAGDAGEDVEDVADVASEAGEAAPGDVGAATDARGAIVDPRTVDARRSGGDEAASGALGPSGDARTADALAALRSRDPARVRATLEAASPLEAALVADAIALLASDACAEAAGAALARVAPAHVGQLADALLDRSGPLALRRAIPDLLAQCVSARAIDGLGRGLSDDQFEIRRRCGVALARLHERDAALRPPVDVVYAAIEREAELGRRILPRHGEAVAPDAGAGRDARAGVELDRFVRDRAAQSYAHVFTLLTLVLPRESIRGAERALHSHDPLARGSALEYLEGALPARVRAALWPFLEPPDGV